METKPDVPLDKNKNKCIGCAYFSYFTSGHSPHTEIGEMTFKMRTEIIEGTWIAGNYINLRCAKGLKAPRDLSNEILHDAKCPVKKFVIFWKRSDWKPYREGLHPISALENERFLYTISLSKRNLIIGILALSVAVVILILTIINTC